MQHSETSSLLGKGNNNVIPAGHNKKHRVFLAALACIQNSILGGLLYGWASIDRTMLTAPATGGGAGLSLDETTKIFSWACSIGMIAPLFLGGILLDQYGPRTCSIVGQICIGFGCQIFALSTNFITYVIGACCIAFGGPGIQISIVHIANLFPNNQFLILSLLNGTVSISFAIFAFFDWLWEKDIQFASLNNYRYLFTYLVVIVIASLIASIMYWPDKAFDPPDQYELTDHHTAEEDYIEATTAHQHHLLEQPLDSYLRIVDHDHRMLTRTESYIASTKALQMGKQRLISIKDMPFQQQLFSGTYIRALVVFIVSSFLTNFYIASFSIEMADLDTYTSIEQHILARQLTLIMAGSTIASILVGWLMDRVGLVFCAMLTLLLGQLQMIVLLLRGLSYQSWMLVSFIIYVNFRQYLYPVFIASLTSRLGFKYFGLLSGIGFSTAGLAQIFMPMLVRQVQGDCHLFPSQQSNDLQCDNGKWIQLHVIEIIILLALTVVPYFDHIQAKQSEKNAKEFLKAMKGNSPMIKPMSTLSRVDEHV